MAEIESPTLGGFEALSGLITKQGGVPSGITEEDPELTTEELKAKLEEDGEIEEESDEGDEGDDGESEENEGIEDLEEEIEEQEEEDEDNTPEDKTTPDLAEAEPEIAKYMAEQLAQEMGWTFEDEKFTSVKDVVDYMAAVVQESSKPDYSSEEMQKLDDFVRDGGNLRDFYDQAVGGRVDPEAVDLAVEENQRAVIRENLRNQGYKDERINKYIERYQDAETLEDEATDALDLIKEYNTRQEERLLNDQKKQSEEYQKQQQKFYSDVEDSIKSLTDVRGISINDKQKKELIEYIFKPNEEGLTKYQKDYASNVTNLIESAFFTKEKDTFFKQVQKKAESEAYKSLQKKLKVSKAKRTKQSQQDEGSASSGIGILGSQLFKKPE